MTGLQWSVSTLLIRANLKKAVCEPYQQSFRGIDGQGHQTASRQVPAVSPNYIRETLIAELGDHGSTAEAKHSDDVLVSPQLLERSRL